MAHAEPLTSDLGRVSHSLGFRAPRSQGLQVSLGHFLELGLNSTDDIQASCGKLVCSEMSQSIQFHQGQKTWYEYVYQADNFHLSGLLMGRVQLPGRVCHGPWASLCCHLKAETENLLELLISVVPWLQDIASGAGHYGMGHDIFLKDSFRRHAGAAVRMSTPYWLRLGALTSLAACQPSTPTQAGLKDFFQLPPPTDAGALEALECLRYFDAHTMRCRMM